MQQGENTTRYAPVRRSQALGTRISGSARSTASTGTGAILLAALGILVPLAASAQPAQERKIIRKVDIVGLKRTPKAALSRQLGKIQVGQVYDAEAKSQETGRLLLLGNFDEVRTVVEDFENGVAVIFHVTEKPLVSKLVLFGRNELSEKEIVSSEPALFTREGDVYNRYWVQQDEEAIREKYLKDGYLFAQVTQSVAENESGVTVTFTISEGTRVRIRRVNFVGNRAIPSGDLLGLMNTREKDFWFFGLLRPGFYDSGALQADLLTLMNYYRQFGYFDVRAEPEEVRADGTKEKLNITVRIDEGPVYVFRGYRFSNNAVFSDQTLRKLTSAPIGKPFRLENMQKDQNDILKYYGDRAYIFAKADPKFEYALDRPEVHVRFEVEEEDEIYIEHVRIEGNLKTQDRVIRRELEAFPGERVDRSDLVKSRSNLARLGLFRDITYEFDGTGQQRDLIFTVDEDTSGQLVVGFGVTSGFGVIGNLSITKRNFDITDLPDSIYEIPDRFTGAGQTLHLVAQPGTRRSLYRLTFVEPYLFDTPNSLRLSASSLELIREDWDEARATFAPRLGHSFDFDRDYQVSLGMRLGNVKVDDIEPNAPTDVVLSQGHSSVITMNTAMTYNKALFEPLEGPYDGHRETIFYEHGGGIFGGDVDFHRVELSNEFFFPLYVHEEQNLHHVISLANRFGLIQPQESDDFIPVFERYFLGGPHTVRGFKFRGMGPHENGSPFGGTAEIHGNLEYTFPIFGKFLRGVGFLDYGNLQGRISALDLDEMRYVTGAGVRINFPFLGGAPLPIGLFFGVPIRKEDQDRERMFLFTIGTPFGLGPIAPGSF